MNGKLNKYYSCEISDIDKSTNLLIFQNAEYLINYIYKNKTKEPYNTAETRIGLSIKILLKSEQLYSPEILSYIVDDIQFLLTDENHLNKYLSRDLRINALSQELALINKFLDLDDTISLNTLKGYAGWT